jgi:hypothetical protein
MNDHADLEISLRHHDLESYDVDLRVELRYSRSRRDDEIRVSRGRVQFDIPALQALTTDPQAYGSALSQALFADPSVRSEFEQARAVAQQSEMPMRLRLMIGPSARELHRLRWETLRDPQDDSPLCTDETLFFSRYLSSRDWRAARLRAKGDLHALAVVANPADLAQYELAPVDVSGELERAQAGLGDISMTSLPGDGSLGGEGAAERASLGNLLAHLRDDECDILYLVAHGSLAKGEAWLWLEDEETGDVSRVSGGELAERIHDMVQPPRLIVLASCESAGDGAGDALAALGPRLAEAGVPAVLAMQGKVSVETVAQFMPVFFSELQGDDQIDRALAVARGVVRDRPDYWMPVLYMRLRSGRIWYVPGFGGEVGEFEKWPALLQDIGRGKCTPIVGHGMVAPIVGSLYEIAQDWAQKYHYPMAPHERGSLPRVAQYLTIHQGQRFPYLGLGESLRQEIQQRYAAVLPEDKRQGRVPIDELVEIIGAKRRADDPCEPHKALARLNLPIYVTTNVDNLLTSALAEVGRDPQVVICPWNRHLERLESVFDRESDYLPTPERPLVYHLFGRLGQPESLVLTEDDYFDYLIGITRNKDLVPPSVRAMLTDSALLFLGFQVSDWSFRVLLRSVLSREGGDRRFGYNHIAAQIEPDEDRILEPERARRYMEEYFIADAQINLYWGSVEDFCRELLPRWENSSGEGG